MWLDSWKKICAREKFLEKNFRSKPWKKNQQLKHSSETAMSCLVGWCLLRFFLCFFSRNREIDTPRESTPGRHCPFYTKKWCPAPARGQIRVSGAIGAKIGLRKAFALGISACLEERFLAECRFRDFRLKKHRKKRNKHNPINHDMAVSLLCLSCWFFFQGFERKFFFRIFSRRANFFSSSKIRAENRQFNPPS